MKNQLLHPLLLAAIFCGASIQEADAQRPAPLISPELGAEGSVTFRFKADKASAVKVRGQFGPETALTKGDGGVWTATISGVKPGIYEYNFNVDGLNVMDPQNTAIKPQRWPGSSVLHVPANPPAPWDWQPAIPHGVVHVHAYQSKALGKMRRIFVYTPPGAGDAPLPVLYLSHGYSDNEATWSVHGKAPWILDALIAEKKAVPMIVVMPDAHALPPGEGAFEKYGPENSAALCRELIEDILPIVESSYKTQPGTAARAFAGLSMGGHHALTVALNHHDRFGWIGAFSSAPPPVETVAAGLDKPDATNADLKLLWIACGKNDFLYKRNNEFVVILKDKSIRHQYLETEGDHSWPVWRRYLTEFAPLLFR